MRRITKAALGGLAGCALVLGGVQAASGETLLQQVFPGWLTDLDSDDEAPEGSPWAGQPMTGAFDSAKAKLKVIETSDGITTFSLEVREIDQDLVPDNHVFGSHLHTGGCKTDDPDGTGPHYKRPVDPNNLTQPLWEREVWFDLEPKGGVAVSKTERPFVPGDVDSVGDTMSIVIHRDPTNTNPLLGTVGSAGPKEVCLPLDVSTTWALQ